MYVCINMLCNFAYPKSEYYKLGNFFFQELRYFFIKTADTTCNQLGITRK